MLRVVQCCELEEGVDGAEPRVAGAHRVPPFGFKMMEEPSDGDGVDVSEVQSRRCGAGRVGEVCEEQPERISVGGDGVRTGVALPHQTLGEEGLQGRRQRGHDSSPGRTSSFRAARASSSGAAC